MFFRFCGFSAACFLIEVQTFEKSRTDPFFLKTTGYSLNSDYNQKSEIQHLKLPVRTCITVAAGPKTVLFNPGIRNRFQGIILLLLYRFQGIDSASLLARRAGTKTLFLLGSQPPQIDQKFQHWNRT